jgi:hypothetical protein
MLPVLPLELVSAILELLPYRERSFVTQACAGLYRQRALLPCVYMTNNTIVLQAGITQPFATVTVNAHGSVVHSRKGWTVSGIGMCSSQLLALVVTMVRRAPIAPASKALALLHCCSQPALRATPGGLRRTQQILAELQRSAEWSQLPANVRAILEIDVLPHILSSERTSVAELLRQRLIVIAAQPTCHCAPVEVMTLARLVAHAAQIVGSRPQLLA